jgi:hypothetical protein
VSKKDEIVDVDVESGELVESDADELPVVARLMVEIRSDGSRTIARGAMEDVLSGEKVAIEARGSTPMSLALGLAKSMMRGRAFARSAARALLPRSKKKR